MAFCTQCGNELKEGAVFCPNCGHRRIQQDETGVPIKDGGESRYEDRRCAFDPQEPPAGANKNLGYRGPEIQPVNSGAKTAIIVISSIVVLIAVAVILIARAVTPKSYEGYWETTKVDMGAGYSDKMFSYDAQGLYGLQLSEDGSCEMISAFENEGVTGTWNEVRGGVLLQIDGTMVQLTRRGDGLVFSGGYTYLFERSDRSIDDPTLKAGIYAGDAPQTPAVSPAPSGAVAGSGYVGDENYYISVVGAEEFTDIDNEPAIRIYYEFTNYFEYPQQAYYSLNITASQNGLPLEDAYCWDDVDVFNNDVLNIRTGIKIQCCVQFKYDPSAGSVDVSFYSEEEEQAGGVVAATYVPGEFPGAPAPLVIAPIPDPDWTTGLPSEGSLDDGDIYVVVSSAELITDAYGNDAIRVYYEFTNSGCAEPVSMYMASYPFAYQDGVGLLETYADIGSDTDENYYTEIGMGETITASIIFRLRNNSSAVEAEVEASYTYDAVGETFLLQ